MKMVASSIGMELRSGRGGTIEPVAVTACRLFRASAFRRRRHFRYAPPWRGQALVDALVTHQPMSFFVSSLMPDSHPPSPHGDVPASQPTSSTLNINTLADFAASLPPSLRGLDPSVLVSMLTALTTGQSNTPVALPQPETGHNMTIRTHSPAVPMSQVRHLVPPEALPPSPTMARLAQPVEYPTVPGPPRSQMYPVVPWNYGDRSAPGHTSTPARENVGQMRTSLDPALQSDGGLMGHDHGGDVGGSQASSDTSGGSWELSQLSPAGRAALNDLIKKQVEVVVAKREREPEADPGPVVRASKKSRGVILEPREIPVKVRHAIWTNTHFLLGTGADATISQTGRPTHFKLPKPDDPVKYAPDGTRLYNPDWGIPIDEGINDQFISAVVKLTMSNGANPPFNLSADVVGDEGLLTLAAKAYLKSLKRMFMLQSSGDRGTQQLTKKRVSDKLHGRRARKCDNLASAIPMFRKVFGHANTVGIEEVVQVGWMSDEHSAGEGKEDAARELLRRSLCHGHPVSFSSLSLVPPLCHVILSHATSPFPTGSHGCCITTLSPSATSSPHHLYSQP
ncbi:hypothetical protein C8Q73DRAFT_683249 [Cubamyces lactineus]|nr:hypothetical protein C8Q73DRAFT_683249 [Cubamyces lactineus]